MRCLLALLTRHANCIAGEVASWSGESNREMYQGATKEFPNHLLVFVMFFLPAPQAMPRTFTLCRIRV